MKYYVEETLSNFKFWSGGADRAKQLTHSELDKLDDLLPELLGDDCTDTAINDLFWFEFEQVVELIGLRLNGSGDIIRGIDDVDDDIVTEAVSDWADDNGYELDDSQVQALVDAIWEADGLDLDDDCAVTVDDDVATECAERLGYSLEDDCTPAVDDGVDDGVAAKCTKRPRRLGISAFDEDWKDEPLPTL